MPPNVGTRHSIAVVLVVAFTSSSVKGFSTFGKVYPFGPSKGAQQQEHHRHQRRQQQQATFLEVPLRTSFCHSLLSVKPRRRLRVSILFLSLSRFENSDGEDFDVTDFLFPSFEKEVSLEVKPELWLDLRRTALSPRIATESLLEATTKTADRHDSLIDRILVSEEKVGMAMERGLDPPAVVWFEHEDSGMNSSPTATSTLRRLPFLEQDPDFSGLPGVPEGRIVPITNDGRQLPDPIPYLETVDRGGWVMVDSTEQRKANLENQLENILKNKGNVSEDDDCKGRYDAVTGFVDFLLSAAGGSMLKSPILLGTPDQEDDDDDSCLTIGGCGAGGVAIRCTRKEDILRFASYFQSTLLADTLQRGGGGVGGSGGGVLSETKSGIVFQSLQDDDLSLAKDGESPNDVRTQLRYALVLPYDAVMWKAASLLSA